MDNESRPPKIVHLSDEPIQALENEKIYVIVQATKPDWFLIGALCIMGIGLIVHSFIGKKNGET